MNMVPFFSTVLGNLRAALVLLSFETTTSIWSKNFKSFPIEGRDFVDVNNKKDNSDLSVR